VKYWVCEKSDGIRAFMFLNENQIYFVDRRFDFYRLEEENFIIPEANNLDIMQNQTLLDGEITYNFHYKKYCYMIFDVLAVCGKR
jgi:mRNA guanylyltransferase